MVVVLGDDLLQLLQAVLFELRGGVIGHVAQERGAVERRIDPRQHAQLVATVVEVLRMGHHGRAQGVGSEGADLAEVGVIVGRYECAARDGVVVVERYAVYRDADAVDRKAACRGRRDAAETRTNGYAVGDGRVADTHRYPVEGRAGGAPQPGGVDREGNRDGFPVEARLLPFGKYAAAVGRRDVERQDAAVLPAGDEVYLRFAFDPVFADRVLAHQYAVRAEVEGRYGGLFREDQLGFAVDAPVEVHVRRGGKHVVAVVVADHDQQRIVGTEPYLVGDFERKSRTSALVPADIIAVDEDVGHALHAVEFHE